MELEDDPESSPTRIPCQFCGRKFAPESLGKHTNVCEKTSSKKRKTFDSAKQRIQGTELAEFASTDHLKRYDPVVPTPVKEKHIPAAKVANTIPLVPPRKSHKTTSPLNKSSNYERCPYCDRSFGPKAFDRHLDWCKEQSIRINLKSAATQEAKERLEARTKYRAPSFKSKRSITKEKYSPKLKNGEPRTVSNCKGKDDESKEKENKMTSSYENEMKMKTPTRVFDKPKPKENREVNFIRQNVLRCSYRSRLPKKGENKIDNDKINNNYQNAKKTDFSGIEEWISANGTKIEPTQLPSKVSPTCSQLTSSLYDGGYDPFTLAEHQMKELFGDSNPPFDLRLNQTRSLNSTRPLKEDRLQKSQNKENISYEQLLQQQQLCGPVKSKSCQTSGGNGEPRQKQQNFKTSPTSAFSKYSASAASSNGGGNSRVVGVPSQAVPVQDAMLDQDVYNFLPPLVSSNAKREPYGNPSRNSSSGSSHETTNNNNNNNMNRYPLISLSNISLCSSVSVELPEENCSNRKCAKMAADRSCCSATSTVDGVSADVPVPVRSFSTQSSEQKPSSKNHQKRSLRMEHMLYGNEDQSMEALSGPNTPDLFEEKLEKLNSFLDADDLDLMNSFAEFECALQNSCCDTDLFLRDAHSPDDKLAMKLRRGDSIASKMSIDSAYNSLNRKSPILYETSSFMGGQTSTPEMENTIKSSALSPSPTSDSHDTRLQTKLSKFCHECGAKFPLVIAKFCCECGVRRLAI